MIIFFPLTLFMYLPLIAIDVLIFFVIVRLLRCKWTIPCLEAFDTTGTPVVDWFSDHIERILSRLSNKTFSQITQLSIGTSILILVRIFLTTLLCN